MEKIGIFHANQTSTCLDPHGWYRETSLSPLVKIFLLVLLLWIIFVIYGSCLSCFLVCSTHPCDHLLADLLVSLYFCHFPIWCHGAGVVLD